MLLENAGILEQVELQLQQPAGRTLCLQGRGVGNRNINLIEKLKINWEPFHSLKVDDQRSCIIQLHCGLITSNETRRNDSHLSS